MKMIFVFLFLFCFNVFGREIYHCINNGVVENSVVVSDKTDQSFKDAMNEKCEFFKKDEGAGASKNWIYSNGVLGVGAKFTRPPEPPPTAEQIEELSREQERQKRIQRIKNGCSTATGLMKDICAVVGGG